VHNAATVASTVDEYLAALPPDRRAAMEKLRATIRAAAPDAIESIAYQMPAFRIGGRFLVSYAAYKHHYSLFPLSERVEAELGPEVARYAHGRGTIRFPADEPIPLDLVARIVRTRLDEDAAR
jgi:uncharacterized protein YdhG (YjbR/CyaY superfamily)